MGYPCERRLKLLLLLLPLQLPLLLPLLLLLLRALSPPAGVHLERRLGNLSQRVPPRAPPGRFTPAV